MSAPIRPEFEPLRESEPPSHSARSAILPWLRLMRLPNVFTAVADVAMGYLFVQRGITDGLVLGCLIAASACLYTAGIVFNNVFDYKNGAQERTFPPIPPGPKPPLSAGSPGGILLVVGGFLGLVTR